MSEITPKAHGAKVKLGGWVDSVREHGNIKFLILRDSSGTAQLTAKKGESAEAVMKSIGGLVKESVVLVEGIVRKSEKALRGVEVVPSKLEVLSRSERVLPIDPNVGASLDKRLDWRFLDFRQPKTRAIFTVQNCILRTFRGFFEKRGFVEMQPPVIIASASEGGAELFPLDYFGRKAYLAQSPQLYKQMGAVSFEKVFMILPVFRAEKFDSPAHVNEIRQLDVEIAFADDELAIQLLEEFFIQCVKSVGKERREELKLLEVQLKMPKAPLERLTYSKAIELLKKSGETIQWGDDFSKGQEALLTKLVKTSAFIMKDWPSDIKAFYAMPYENNPKLCKAYDLLYNGIEIASGTQRIHDPQLLAERIKAKGMEPKNFEFYISCFRYGAPPHAGWSIGLERFTMALLGAKNIRECTMFPRDRNRLAP